MIRFVIPAYNEAENIPRPARGPRAPGARARGPRDLRRRRLDRRHERGDQAHCQDLHLAIVRHEVNRGLGTAINSGLRAALGEAQDDDAIVTLESDNTSDLDDLPAHARALQRGQRRRARLGLRAGRADHRRRRRGGCAASKAVSNTFRHARRAAGDPHAVLAVSRLPRRHAAARRRDLRLPARARAGLRGQRRAAAEALQRRRHGGRGADGQRLEPARWASRR